MNAREREKAERAVRRIARSREIRAAKKGHGLTAINVGKILDIFAHTSQPLPLGTPTSWWEAYQIALQTEALPIDQRRRLDGESDPTEDIRDIRRLVTWFLGDHGVIEDKSLAEYRYCWED